MDAVKEFQREYRFLSNFYPAVVSYEGLSYPTVEHAYQAAKVKPEIRPLFQKISTPGAAKRMVRKFPLPRNWELIKEEIMLGLLRQKFHHPHFRTWLLETGDAELIEGNRWHDTYWGVCDGVGQNRLGKLLMQVRKEASKITLDFEQGV